MSSSPLSHLAPLLLISLVSSAVAPAASGSPGGSEARARLCPPAPAAAPASGTPPSGAIAGGAIAGRAVNGETGRPLPGVLVWEAAWPASHTRADEGGRFRLELPTTGGLCAAASGFVAIEQPVLSPAATNGILDRLRLILWPTRLLRGKVVTADHRPLRKARVHLGVPYGLAGSAEQIRAALPDEASAGPDGTFDFVWAAASRAALTIRAPGFVPASVEAAAPSNGHGTIDLGEIALSPSASLAGEVRDGDGHAVSGAAVSASTPSGGAQAVTGSRGEFVLGDLRPGEILILRVEHVGFAPALLSGVAVPRLRPLAVELRRARVLRGRIVDDGGDPVPGARIVALALAKHGDGTGLPELGRFEELATAGPMGRFTLRDLAAGRLRLAASAPGFLSTEQETDLAADGVAEDLELTLRRGAVVEGQVLTAQGDPVAGARVQVVDNGDRALGAEPPAAITSEDGAYRLVGVGEGRRSLRAERGGAPPAVGSLAVGPGDNRLDLTLPAGFEVGGRVVTSAGEPVAGAQVALVPAAEGSAPPPPAEASGTDGSFLWSAVAEGRYRLRADKPGFGGPPLEVAVSGGPVSGLEVQLDKGGAIAGRIAGVRPEQMPLVEVRASAPDRRDQIATPGADGGYRIDELGPGSWTVAAQLAGTSRAARSGILVLPGQEVELDLAFGGGVTLVGTVGRDGVPVSGAWVTAQGGAGSAAAATGADGRFRIESLPPGPYEVTVVHPGSGLASDVRFELEADQDLTLELPGARASARTASGGAGSNGTPR